MSKLYPIFVLITYIIMLYMWIRVIAEPDYYLDIIYITKAIGISSGFVMMMIAAFVNHGVLFGICVYGSAIVFLILLCVIAFIKRKGKDKIRIEEDRRIQKRILSSSIYHAIIEEFNKNNYGAVYVCNDSVVFCQSVSELSFPDEIFFSSTTSQIEADRKAEFRAGEWEQKNMSRYGGASFSNAECIFWYSKFGYTNMRKDQMKTFTVLLAEKLQLKCRIVNKRFVAEGGTAYSGPTGAVTVNGVTTFTGYSETEYATGTYWLPLFGVVYREKEKVVENLEQW